jgi:peptide/nickel transport system permease protein
MSVATGDPSVIGALSATAPRERSRWQSTKRFVQKYPRIVGFGVFVAFLITICLLAPVIAPYNPREPNTQERLQSPSRDHLMGTDQLGRDIFTRVLYGGRVSVPLPMMAVVISATIGLTLGVISAFYGGATDLAVGRLVDAQLAFPELVLLLLIANVFRPSLFGLMLILGLTGYTGTFVLTRGQVLQAREFDYVNAARALGASTPRLLIRHIIPNILNPLFVTWTLAAGGTVLLLATLTFFGLGPQAGTPDWGAMFNDGLNNIRLQPWLMFGPALAVVSTAFAFFMLGDALRDAIDPRLRGGGKAL